MLSLEAHETIRRAIRGEDFNVVTALIGDDRSTLDAVLEPFGGWLHLATEAGRLELVQWLVEQGVDIDQRGGVAGGSAIHRAASDGHLDIVRFLLGVGASLDVSEPVRNPLFGAIYGGHTEVARVLIDSGIDTTVKYSGKHMQDVDAVAYAVEWGRGDIVAILNDV